MLSDFSDQSEGSCTNLFHKPYYEYFITRFSVTRRAFSQDDHCRVVTDSTVPVVSNTQEEANGLTNRHRQNEANYYTRPHTKHGGGAHWQQSASCSVGTGWAGGGAANLDKRPPVPIWCALTHYCRRLPYVTSQRTVQHQIPTVDINQ